MDGGNPLDAGFKRSIDETIDGHGGPVRERVWGRKTLFWSMVAQQFSIWPLFICSGVLGEPALPCGLTVCGVFRVGRDLRARRFPVSRPY
jgi:hypothetical protein